MLAGRECVLVRVFDFLEAFPPATPHANESAGEAECGKANASAGSFSQCHLLMTLSIRCLITPSASHMAGVTPTPRLCRHPCVRACRLFSSNNVFSLPANAFKCSLVKKKKKGVLTCLSCFSAARRQLVERRFFSVPIKKK